MGGKGEVITPVDGDVREVVEQLVKLVDPQIIYLYNRRVNAVGEATGFKLCVVAPVKDKQGAERTLYREVDSPVPFDLLLYTPGEWEEITARAGSFAQKILATGTIIYG